MTLPNPTYPAATRGKVVVWGYLASYPFGGMTWQVLHYLAGLRNLGFDVWYAEDTNAEVRDPETLWETDQYTLNVEFLRRRMESVGLGDRWIFRPPGRYDLCLGAAYDVYGLYDLYRTADAVINLCGSHELRAEHDQIQCLIYLETDPVRNQIAVAKGDQRTIGELDRYDFLFTYGENIGADDCLIPVEHFTWHATRPPVIVDWWRSSGGWAASKAFSTVTSWAHRWNDVTWQGERWHWSKDREFRKLRLLPQRCEVPIELAVDGISEAEADSFRASGWRIRPASDLRDPDVYRDYIRDSLGEFTIAKEQVARTRTGWFSDRSACYLAAGRPVVTQETGFSKYLPCGTGLMPFVTTDDAKEALETIACDYDRHCEAAATIALDYFNAHDVLRRMMGTVGLL